MKKTIVILSALAVVLACNSGEPSEKNASETSKQENTAKAEDPEIAKGLDLVAQSDCFTCHKVADQSTGPSYEAVAAKYPDNDQVIDSLAQKIVKGGTGNWGTVPMTPHPDISDADAKTMMKYILSLK